jgi:hypothetical protein
MPCHPRGRAATFCVTSPAARLAPRRAALPRLAEPLPCKPRMGHGGLNRALGSSLWRTRETRGSRIGAGLSAKTTHRRTGQNSPSKPVKRDACGASKVPRLGKRRASAVVPTRRASSAALCRTSRSRCLARLEGFELERQHLEGYFVAGTSGLRESVPYWWHMQTVRCTHASS